MIPLSGWGQGGAGTRENKGGRWAGSGSHVRVGGGRRMRDIKFLMTF